MRGRVRTWNDDDFKAAVAKHTNFTDVLRELGLRPAGGNHASMKRHAARLSLDTSHFDNERRVRGLRRSNEQSRRQVTDLLCEGSHVGTSVLRRWAVRHIVPMRCSICGNDGEWQGKPLTLQLDHANGVYNDNRLENLRWLCPNCHSQTPTFAGRGSVRRVREAPSFYRAVHAAARRAALVRPR